MMQQKFMKRALEEAQKGVDAGDGGPFGAVIVKGGEIIAAGHNEVVKNNDPTAHAEIVTIRKASRKLAHFHLTGCQLYITAEPCPMCFAAIHWAHIEKVFYCNTKTQSAQIGFDDTIITEIIEHRRPNPIVFVHTPMESCHTLFKKWFDKPDKVLY